MWYLPLLVIWQHQPTAASLMPRAWESEGDVQQPVQGEREKQKWHSVWQRWNLAVEPFLPAVILFKLPLDLLTEMILCCQRQQPTVWMDPIFSRKFCPQWTLTTLCSDGQGRLWADETIETLTFLSSKKPQANRKICLLTVWQRWKNETIQLAETTPWALLALNFHNPVKGSACCYPFSLLTKLLSGHHSWGHWSFVSRQNLPFLAFPSLSTGYITGLEAAVCLLGFLPTHGCGGNLSVLVPSHSPCSCSPLEGGERMSMASHPVRRSLQMSSPCTQGRTLRSERAWTESSSTERGTMEAGCNR